MGDLQQTLDVEVSLEMRRQGVESAVDVGLVGLGAGFATFEPVKKRVAKIVRREQAVQVAAAHQAVVGDRAVRSVAEGEHRAREIGAGGLPHMHEIAGDRLAGGGVEPGGLGQLFGV